MTPCSDMATQYTWESWCLTGPGCRSGPYTKPIRKRTAAGNCMMQLQGRYSGESPTLLIQAGVWPGILTQITGDMKCGPGKPTVFTIKTEQKFQRYSLRPTISGYTGTAISRTNYWTGHIWTNGTGAGQRGLFHSKITARHLITAQRQIRA